MNSIHTKAKEALEQTRATMNKYYDQHRQEQPVYQVGDQVMLQARNIRTKRPTKKLAPKLYGPFRIKKKIGTRAYELDLKDRWRIHKVFHTTLLEPYRENPFHERPAIRPHPEEIDGSLEYEIEAIIQSEIKNTRTRRNGRTRNHKSLIFLVKWKGYPHDENTWEPASELDGAQEAIEEFYRNNPQAPKL
jgi:uncharacterized protein (DUF952 family)